MQFIVSLGHLLINVCNKQKCFKMDVASFCNNNKFTIELTQVSVS
jgi:hypothetical protein